MMERFSKILSPWFQVLADIKKKAADAGLTEKEIVELPQMIIGEINKEIKPRERNMLNLKEKDIPAAREIAERVLADYLG